MRKSTRDTKKPELFSFADTSARMDESDEEDFADSSQSISKPVNIKKTKDMTLFDTFKSGGNKTMEIIGK